VAPWIPFTPIMGIVVSLLMMVSLGWETWARLIIWLAIGLCIYFFYGKKNSRVQRGEYSTPNPNTDRTPTMAD
jgi:APA family basic amino acid/polyamine antiporter